MNSNQVNEESYVLFELVGTTYAVRTSDVQQLEMIEHITPVPNSPPAVDGVVFSRGQVIPAINLRARFGFSKIEYDMRSRLLVINVEGRNIGLIVDTAREFKHIPNEAVSPPPDTLSGMSSKYLDGIATIDDKLILLLNLAEVIKTTEEMASEVEN